MSDDVNLYKPNELIGAIDQIEVPRIAKHLLNYFLQYAQREIKYNKNHKGYNFEVSVQQINGLADFQTHDYQRLQKTLRTLIQPVVLQDNPQCYEALAPITHIKVDIPKGVYNYGLNPLLFDLLRDTDYYTKLQLGEFNGLQSKHSIVLYEWLKRYETAKKIPELSLEDLRTMTGTADKKGYDDFANVRSKILNIAVREISEQTNYTLTYTTIQKKLRYRPRVVAIQFELQRKKPDVIDGETVEQSIERRMSEEVLNKRIDVDSTYEILCNRYIHFGFCSTAEDFYRATYLIDFKCLEWFCENKKEYVQRDKLKWLYDDINKKRRRGRYPEQFEYYKNSVSHLSTRDQQLVREAESRLGFCSLLLRVKEMLGDDSMIDVPKWL